MDVLVKSLSAVSDSGLSELAGSFSQRAEMLSRQGGQEAAVWLNVFSVLALTAESALLSKRTGVAL